MPPSEALSKLAAEFIVLYVPSDRQDAAMDTLASLLNLALAEGASASEAFA